MVITEGMQLYHGFVLVFFKFMLPFLVFKILSKAGTRRTRLMLGKPMDFKLTPKEKMYSGHFSRWGKTALINFNRRMFPRLFFIPSEGRLHYSLAFSNHQNFRVDFEILIFLMNLEK